MIMYAYSILFMYVYMYVVAASGGGEKKAGRDGVPPRQLRLQ